MVIDSQMLNHRITSSTNIMYILVSEKTLYSATILQETIESKGLLKIRKLPKDLMALNNSLNLFSINISLNIKSPYNVLTISEQHLLAKKEYDFLNSIDVLYNFSEQVVVFVIDNKCKKLERIINNIKSIKSNFIYFTHYQSNLETVLTSNRNYFTNAREFISLIERDIDNLREMLINKTGNNEYANFTVNLKSEFNLESSPFNKPSSFLPSKSNYYVLNQIICNYWINLEDAIVTDTNAFIASDNDDPNRVKIILEKAKTIDQLNYLVRQDHTQISIVDPEFEPLILILPYHNPKWKEKVTTLIKSNKSLKKSFKNLLNLLTSEQNLNYLIEFNTDDISTYRYAPDSVRMALGERYALLDSLAYLHSSFTYSPILRLPVIGKSINKELSYFSPETNNFFDNQTNSYKSILKFGDKLKELVISVDSEEYIKNRNGQLVVISDLPVEWLFLNNVPLCFTHDVCRIPESNYAGIKNQYSMNNRFEFNISDNIIKKTLIIHGASHLPDVDKPMKAWFPKVEELSRSLGFNRVHCKTLQEVADSIEKFKPDLLIFDCHGGVDKKTSSSHLLINGKKMTGEFITKNKISAPIVFLSACNTSPNYGYINLIADAFFQVGALTVTSTFLPITVNKASILFIRLLVQLNQTLNTVVHRNWLDFVSHINRTTIIQEALLGSLKKSKEATESITKEESIEIATIMAKSMIFKERKKIFHDLITRNLEINNAINLKIDNLNTEFLLYSQLGRPDLIFFKNWIDKNLNTNFSNETD